MDFTILISNYTTGLANSFGGLAGNSRNPSNDQYDALDTHSSVPNLLGLVRDFQSFG